MRHHDLADADLGLVLQQLLLLSPPLQLVVLPAERDGVCGDELHQAEQNHQVDLAHAHDLVERPVHVGRPWEQILEPPTEEVRDDAEGDQQSRDPGMRASPLRYPSIGIDANDAVEDGRAEP